jgi:hypothetical protein
MGTPMMDIGQAPPPDGPSDVARLADAIEHVAAAVASHAERPTESVLQLPPMLKKMMYPNPAIARVPFPSQIFDLSKVPPHVAYNMQLEFSTSGSGSDLQLTWISANGDRLGVWMFR